jgi:hypothetical protein
MSENNIGSASFKLQAYIVNVGFNAHLFANGVKNDAHPNTYFRIPVFLTPIPIIQGLLFVLTTKDNEVNKNNNSFKSGAYGTSFLIMNKKLRTRPIYNVYPLFRWPCTSPHPEHKHNLCCQSA